MSINQPAKLPCSEWKLKLPVNERFLEPNIRLGTCEIHTKLQGPRMTTNFKLGKPYHMRCITPSLE